MEEEEEDEAEPDEEEEECSRLVAVRAQSAGENPSVQPITSSSSSSSITEQLSADLMVETRPGTTPWRRNYLLKNYGWPSYVQLLFRCLSCLAQDKQLLGSLGQVRNKPRQSGGWPWPAWLWRVRSRSSRPSFRCSVPLRSRKEIY